MAGTTTNFAIPYPTATDYVTDGATAMKSLADQVDAAMFTGSSSGNLLINGAMQVTQRKSVGTAVTGITTSGIYTADRHYFDVVTAGTWTQTTVASAPDGSGLRNSLKLQCTTAQATPTGAFIRQAIEGQNLQSVRKGTSSAKTLTLSFWVAAFQTGTYICELYDQDNTRQCSKAYTINASATWEYKTLTFPADTTGTWDNDNGLSLFAVWAISAGTVYTSGTLNTTWGTVVTANRFVGQTNVASSTSNYWQMTGAQLTVGSVATPFEFKSYANDLRECQRYYQVSYGAVAGYGAPGNAPAQYIKAVETMKSTPTLTIVTAPTYTNASSLVADQLSLDGNRFYFSVGALTGVGYVDSFVYSLNAEF